MSCANEPEFADPRAGDPLTLGELVYEVLHSNLSRAEQCGPTYGETLALDRERFVETFDHAISDDVVDDLPELLGGTILPVVDSGDLPALTEAVAEALALLIDDEFDPDRLTLQSALNVSQARTVLEGSHAIELMRRVLADPLLEERIHALAGLAQEPVGDDDVVGALLELAARNLEDVGEPSACGELEVPGLAEALLKTEGYEDDDGYGAPAWVVRADERGFPRVRRSDLDGRMPAPFVDGDRDGLADVDAEGRFVDGDGDPIAVEPFGRGEGYDADGRALAPDGGYLFEYVDVKQTTLGHVLQIGRDALDADLHHDLADVADAVLGDPQPCDDGPGCLAYPEDDHPIADAAFVLFEVARYERAKAFVDTIATLVEEDPELAEDLLVAIGQVIEALETTDLSLTDRELLDTGVELLPLMSRVFEADAGGESTPRVLLGVVDDLGDTARDFPEQLSYIVDYRDLEKPDACSPEPPDLAMSTPVDWDMPRTYRMGGVDVDNRSALEQVIELLDVAHCGEVPFTGGQTVAYTALDLMADLEPNQVCNIIDLLLGAFDVLPGASDFVVSGALDLIGCDGDRVTAALRSLDALAQSGGLDFLLPVAKVFEERGQLSRPHPASDSATRPPPRGW
ncbi:MAG TPA: hypothetical protein RMH85_12305 [Polyangiaceae bacterium LLY-WYZ-15_(1-7)]|nr:hypothetical protein [Myxococcales bacterium]MAT25947.1 hypothetical protein [Sandaracinus sp.]MBJ71338.1 hypothetical protein [Sandaracinus sp.]HJL02248.1 hypothetical protein [Polyangiaceae bacterium LLY-WYZ-15_(1-7)]HJL09278.1 hypothetical protein [Polyangiaceae bacterium LLY-WYZ-15_(1-7)]